MIESKNSLELIEQEVLNQKKNNRNLYRVLMILIWNIDLKNILLSQGIKKIVIYGLGFVGRAILELLEHMDVKVQMCIDRNGSIVIDGVNVSDDLRGIGDADVVVVTPEEYFEEISNEIKKYSNTDIIKASEFLDNIMTFPQNVLKNVMD